MTREKAQSVVSSDSLPTRIADLRWVALEEARRLFYPRTVVEDRFEFQIVGRLATTTRLAIECFVTPPGTPALSLSYRSKVEKAKVEPDDASVLI